MPLHSQKRHPNYSLSNAISRRFAWIFSMKISENGEAPSGGTYSHSLSFSRRAVMQKAPHSTLIYPQGHRCCTPRCRTLV